MVGSSIIMRGNGFGSSFAEIVSPIVILSRPETAIISPASKEAT